MSSTSNLLIWIRGVGGGKRGGGRFHDFLSPSDSYAACLNFWKHGNMRVEPGKLKDLQVPLLDSLQRKKERDCSRHLQKWPLSTFRVWPFGKLWGRSKYDEMPVLLAEKSALHPSLLIKTGFRKEARSLAPCPRDCHLTWWRLELRANRRLEIADEDDCTFEKGRLRFEAMARLAWRANRRSCGLEIAHPVIPHY